MFSASWGCPRPNFVHKIGRLMPRTRQPAVEGVKGAPPSRLATSRSLVGRAGAARTLFGRGLLFAPGILFALEDLVRRSERLSAMDARGCLFYAFSAFVMIGVWAVLVALSATERRATRSIARTLLVVLAVVAVAGQRYTFVRYDAFVDKNAVLVGTSMLPSIGEQLWSDRVEVIGIVLPPLLVALLVPLVVRRLAPVPGRRAPLLIDVGLVAVLLLATVDPGRGAPQGQPPDAMYLSAMGQLGKAHWYHNRTVERVHPGRRNPRTLPTLTRQRKIERNTIVILTESVRAQSTCVDPKKPCRLTPFSHRAAPARIPLNSFRAVDSTTAISLAVFFTGLPPSADRKAMHEMPIIWEYAHAAGLDTAYWTSQNLLFGNSGTWLEGIPARLRVSATQLEPDATLEVGADDSLLVDHVISRLGALKEPYFAVVHLSNTHYPYKIDPNDAPYLPESKRTGPGADIEITNRYHDAIHHQDRAIGRLIDAIHARPEAERIVTLYLSDHGEQMREKGSVGHTGTLFEPEVHIPLWFDAPEGTLTPNERESLRSLREAPRTSQDIMPTLLDLIGVLDTGAIDSLRRDMPGKSLLRGGSSTDTPFYFTNCTELWACAFKNWGAMQGTRKVFARQYDRRWTCFDVSTDPGENYDLGVEACADLVAVAERGGGGRPFDRDAQQ